MMKFGILGASDIAFRRFLPALEKCGAFSFAGVASRGGGKAQAFICAFGGKSYKGYDALLEDAEIDCVYIPLPPALHFEWGRKALEHGKHVLLEKPFTASLDDTRTLLALAEASGLAVHENYMFQYHSQIDFIRSKLPELGALRLIRLDFGFPFRGAGDFRYKRDLGGGALFDCGGYTLKLASLLLGGSADVVHACLGYSPDFDVDLYGSAVLRDANGTSGTNGLCVQLSFGMDNTYRCRLDVWGSKGNLLADRVFTAPDGFAPTVTIQSESGTANYILEPDDAFAKSILRFADCIQLNDARRQNCAEILKQAQNVEKFRAELK
jgi:predicted dehydrogenase